ncbi:MAG: type II toxin-antitoxin system RelE/ParE family toxin [Holosporales bacterium]|jgi:mRNA-degrading endonuclease YafQ of YafQ-DinJ toxin-antitoxin module|nr:type II toxin-antitoxin system RelE/ParE family toxin [Holosporales bacterium]
MTIQETSRFKKVYKKLNSNQKIDVDSAIRFIIKNPDTGQRKKGNLSAVRIYKFRCVNQLTLLAYTISNDRLVLTLLDVGSHENFYRDLN